MGTNIDLTSVNCDKRPMFSLCELFALVLMRSCDSNTTLGHYQVLIATLSRPEAPIDSFCSFSCYSSTIASPQHRIYTHRGIMSCKIWRLDRPTVDIKASYKSISTHQKTYLRICRLLWRYWRWKWSSWHRTRVIRQVSTSSQLLWHRFSLVCIIKAILVTSSGMISSLMTILCTMDRDFP